MRGVNSIVACCHSAKLCAYAARAFPTTLPHSPWGDVGVKFHEFIITQLLGEIENWFRAQKMRKIHYNFLSAIRGKYERIIAYLIPQCVQTGENFPRDNHLTTSEWRMFSSSWTDRAHLVTVNGKLSCLKGLWLNIINNFYRCIENTFWLLVQCFASKIFSNR